MKQCGCGVWFGGEGLCPDCYDKTLKFNEKYTARITGGSTEEDDSEIMHGHMIEPNTFYGRIHLTPPTIKGFRRLGFQQIFTEKTFLLKVLPKFITRWRGSFYNLWESEIIFGGHYYIRQLHNGKRLFEVFFGSPGGGEMMWGLYDSLDEAKQVATDHFIYRLKTRFEVKEV